MKALLFMSSMLFSCLIASPTNLAVVVTQVAPYYANIVDLTSLSNITIIPCGDFPQYVAVSPDGNFALVTNTSTIGPNGVTVINLTTFETTPIDLNLGSSSPSGIVTTPTNKALICNANANQVSVIDIPTLSVSSIPVPGVCGPFKNSIVLAAGIPSVPDMALVALNSDMVAIDLASLNPAFIPLPSAPTHIAVSKNQKKAFAVLPGASAVVPIDLTATPPIAGALISITNLTNIFIADNFNLALVTTSDNNVVPIDLLSLTPQTPISVGSVPFYIGISGNTAFVANIGGDSITPIDLNLLTALTNIAVGPGPLFVEPSLGLNPIMIVGNSGGNTLSTIDPITLIKGSDISLEPSLSPHDIGFYLLPAVISSPSNISGKQNTINALLQKDIVNIISWGAPLSGEPAFYKLYRDSSLTNLITILNGNETIFYDHNRKKGLAYTYFIVAVDSSGNVSSAASITIP